MEFNYEYTFYIGSHDKDTHTRELTERRMIEIIERILIDEVYTMVDGVGKYRHQDGYIVTEPAKIVTIFTRAYSHDAMECYAKRLANALNQESILLKKQMSNAELFYNNDMEGGI